MPTQRPSLAVKLFGWAFIVAMVLVSAELAAVAYYVVRDGRYISVSERLAGDDNNAFLTEFHQGRTCGYIDSLYPHPFLAHVHRPPQADDPCAWWVNSLGLFGREFPIKRDPTTFAILLTGGSVAAQLAQVAKSQPLYLEEELNRCYRPPHGERFVVLNGADGAWKQPQQAIMTLLYGEAFDAVVSLEGYNEHSGLVGNRIETPNNNFVSVNPFVSHSYATLATIWASNELVKYSAAHWPLNQSFLRAHPGSLDS